MSSIAVIGCGYWGKNIARNFYQLGSLATICDDSPSVIPVAQEVAPGISVTHSLEHVLTSGVKGVAIATPSETHFELAKRSLLAGKDVFVEKPLSLKVSQGKELVEIAKDNNRILMVGHILQYHPAIGKIEELIQSGELGKIHYIYSNRASLGKVRREENILWSFAPHDVAVILRLLKAEPVQVYSCGGSYIQPNIADVTVTCLLFEHGIRAHIFVSWLNPFREQKLVVVGSKKMVSFDDINKELILYDQRVDIERGMPIPFKGDGLKIEIPAVEPLKAECQAFLDSMETRIPPLSDGNEGVAVLNVLEQAQKSINTGTPVIF